MANLSATPPCPGMLSEKSLILKPLFRPEAKNAPNGAITAANRAIKAAWIWAGARLMCSKGPILNGSWYYLDS